MVKQVMTDYNGLSFNDAVRICIRRGFHQVNPSTTIDAPVVSPESPTAPPPAVGPGQLQMDTDMETK